MLVHGTVSIPGSETMTDDGPGTQCWAMGNDPTTQAFGGGLSSPFDDVKAGAQVTVTDAAGTVVGIGKLGDGAAASESDGATSGNLRYPCEFTFDVAGVPAGKRFYGVKVGAHSEQVPGAEIESPTVAFAS